MRKNVIAISQIYFVHRSDLESDPEQESNPGQQMPDFAIVAPFRKVRYYF